MMESTSSPIPGPSTTAKSGTNMALLGGLLSLAIILVIVVVGVVVIFFCYCRKAKGHRYKYRQDAAEEQQGRERDVQREHEERRRNNEPQVPRGNPFKNFVTTETRSPDGAATGMLSVQHLQRIQSRPDGSDTNGERTGRYDASYEAHYVHNQAEYIPSGRVRHDDETIPKRPMDDLYQPAHLQIDREQQYVVATTPTTKKRLLDGVVNQGQPQFEYTEEGSVSADISERYVYGAEITKKRNTDPDYVPIEERAAPPIPLQNRNNEQSDDGTESEFTRTSDHLDSDEDESQATLVNHSSVFQGTWAEKDGPEIHRSGPRLEDDLVCESNVMYESTDVDNEIDNSGSNLQDAARLRNENKFDKTDFHGTGEHTNLSEIEALSQLDKAVEDHMEPVVLAPITMLPPLSNNKLPPLNVAKLPPIELGLAMTLPFPIVVDEVSSNKEPRRTRQRSSSISEDVDRIRRQRRHSVSEEGARKEREPKRRHRSSSQTRDARDDKEIDGRLRTMSSSVSMFNPGNDRYSDKRVGDVPSSPARERRSRTRQKDTTAVVRRSHSEDRSYTGRMKSSAPLSHRRRRESESDKGRYSKDAASDSDHAPDSRYQRDSRRDYARSRDSSRSRPQSGKESNRGQPTSVRTRDSSRSRPDSGKESNITRPDSGRESNRTRPDSGRESNRTRPDSGRESNKTRPDSGRELNRTRPDSGRESNRTRPDSGRARGSSRSRPDSGKENKPNSEHARDSSSAQSESDHLGESRHRPDSGKSSNRSRPDSGRQRQGHRHHTRGNSNDQTLNESMRDKYEQVMSQTVNSTMGEMGTINGSGIQSSDGKKDGEHRYRSDQKEHNNQRRDSRGRHISKNHDSSLNNNSMIKNQSEDDNHNGGHGERHHHRYKKHGDGHHHGNSKHKHKSREEITDDIAMNLHADDELYQLHKKAPSLENTFENGFDKASSMNSTSKSSKRNDSFSRKKDNAQNHKKVSQESSGRIGYTNMAMTSDDEFEV